MGKMYYIMGKSASGKDTIYRRILELCNELEPIVLYTTRPMRSGETDGKEYHFTSEEELKQYSDEGKIIEVRTYQTVAGPWSYATIDDGSFKEDRNYLGIGTLESYNKMIKYFGKEKVEPIYIVVADDARLERALKREKLQTNPNYSELCRRYLADEADFSEDNLKAAGVTEMFENEDLEGCIQRIHQKILCTK